MEQPLKDTKIVLVIEDEQPLIEIIRRRLERDGFEIITARGFEQAKEYVESLGQVDAVWLDHYLLGRETGLDFLAYLKSIPQYASIPVFVVSNTGSPDKKRAYLQLGVEKYYVKANHRLDEIVSDLKNVITM